MRLKRWAGSDQGGFVGREKEFAVHRDGAQSHRDLSPGDHLI